jgi:cohesin complex subunit SCC1
MSFSERTQKMGQYLEKSFSTEERLSFNALFEGKNKRTVAVAFFELLVLKSNKLIDLQQDEPYGDIIITKTDAFVQLIEGVKA